jgi:hypothetical protein
MIELPGSATRGGADILDREQLSILDATDTESHPAARADLQDGPHRRWLTSEMRCYGKSPRGQDVGHSFRLVLSSIGP